MAVAQTEARTAPTLAPRGKEDHLETNRKAFTLRAEAYASSALVTDPDRLQELVTFTKPAKDDRVLEVASGPGHVAMAFAPHCGEVVGVELTAAPLQMARALAAQQRGADNVVFRQGDAYDLPVESGEFDIVVCRYAMHHMEYPLRVIKEMARACRPGGKVVLQDMFASEHPARAAWQEEWEILRDPSHAHVLPIGEMLSLFALAGLESVKVNTFTIQRDVATWIEEAKTPSVDAEKVFRLIEQDAQRGLSFARPYCDAQGAWQLTHHIAMVLGVKLQ